MSQATFLYFSLSDGYILNTIDFDDYNYPDDFHPPQEQLYPIPKEDFSKYSGYEQEYIISPPSLDGEIVYIGPSQ